MTHNYLYGGMILLHILHHANDAPVYGLGIMDELRHHGYEMSSGTLYSLLYTFQHKVNCKVVYNWFKEALIPQLNRKCIVVIEMSEDKAKN